VTALYLILFSAVLHAVVNVLTKRARDKYAMRLVIGVGSALIVAPALFFVPLPHGLAVRLLVATAIVNGAYEFLLANAYESAAFSAVYPIARGTGPLFTVLGAILILGEHPPALQLLGILCVCGGVVTIGFSHRASEGAARGFAFALATGLTIGCYTLIDATGVRAVPNPFSYVLWFFVAHGVCLLFTAPLVRGPGVLREACRYWKYGPLVAALSVGSYGAALLAFRYGATAQIAAMRETSVLFGTALATRFLGERMTLRRWSAAGAIALGAILLQAA
jgi:drug/metabolite transporter (DMT)-like permease